MGLLRFSSSIGLSPGAELGFMPPTLVTVCYQTERVIYASHMK